MPTYFCLISCLVSNTSLQKWFNQKDITDKDRNYIQNLFTATLDHDVVFVKEMGATAEFLRTSFEEISPLIDNHKFEEASMIIKEFSSGLIPKLQRLGMN